MTIASISYKEFTILSHVYYQFNDIIDRESIKNRNNLTTNDITINEASDKSKNSNLRILRNVPDCPRFQLESISGCVTIEYQPVASRIDYFLS